MRLPTLNESKKLKKAVSDKLLNAADKLALGCILVTFASVLAVGITINLIKDSLRGTDEKPCG